jgi:hypothetical protein
MCCLSNLCSTTQHTLDSRLKLRSYLNDETTNTKIEHENTLIRFCFTALLRCFFFDQNLKLMKSIQWPLAYVGLLYFQYAVLVFYFFPNLGYRSFVFVARCVVVIWEFLMISLDMWVPGTGYRACKRPLRL